MSDPDRPARSALLSFRFLGPAVAGTVLMAVVAAFAPSAAQLAMLGAYTSVVGGLFLAYLGQEDVRERRRAAALESLAAPLALAADPDLFRLYRDVSDGLAAVARRGDDVLRSVAVTELTVLAGQVAELAAGRAVFDRTEGWRAVYDRLLAVPDLRTYRSVAWVRTPDYWQDAPGRQSMAANFAAVRRGVRVERAVVLSDALWPPGQPHPDPAIRPWLDHQDARGVRVTLVREADAAREPGLVVDTGIYGDRAVGVQELDDAGRTVRFTLEFDPDAVRRAADRWERLRLYAVPFRRRSDRAGE